MSRLQCGFENQKLIRRDGALHHVFAKAISCADHHGLAEARLGINGEHDTGARKIRAHHAVHADTERDLEMIETFVHAVAEERTATSNGAALLPCSSRYAVVISFCKSASNVALRMA